MNASAFRIEASIRRRVRNLDTPWQENNLMGTSKNIRPWYDDRRSWSRHGQIVRSSASD
jgi:hypothetical protein